MKKRLLFLIIILVIFALPIGINKSGIIIKTAKAAYLTPNELEVLCNEVAKKQLENKTKEERAAKFENTYRSCVALYSENKEVMNTARTKATQSVKNVCTNVVSNYIEDSKLTKNETDNACYLIGLVYECSTDSCFKEKVCNSKLQYVTKYCDSEIPPKNDENNNDLEKVCNDAAEQSKITIGITKKQFKNGCLNALKNVQCSTEECYKKVLCESQFAQFTKYCDAEDPGTGDGKKTDPGTGGGGKTDPGTGGGGKTDPGTGGGEKTDPGTGGGGGSKESTPCAGMEGVVYYFVYVVKVLHIVVPILLIVWASIDLIKSIISGDEKKISNARKPVIQRLISALLVFLLPWLVNMMVFSLTGQDSNTADWSTCWRKAWNGGKQDDSIFNIRNW